jgi:hypothetical protein
MMGLEICNPLATAEDTEMRRGKNTRLRAGRQAGAAEAVLSAGHTGRRAFSDHALWAGLERDGWRAGPDGSGGGGTVTLRQLEAHRCTIANG